MSGFLRNKHVENCFELTGIILRLVSRNFSQAVPHPFKLKSKKRIESHKSFIDKINIENQHEVLSDMVTPYWKISYDEELDLKQKMCEEALEYLFHKLSKKKEDVQKVLERIIASPVRDAYRTKDEFNFWTGVDGQPKTLGFYIGIPAAGKVVSVPATNLKCIKESHKNIAQVYQDLVRSSPLDASYQLFDGGFWRCVVVRSNDAGDHQALVVTHPSTLTPEQISEQQQILAEHFKQHTPTTALFHQSCPHVRCPRDLAPIHLLRGQPHLSESLGGLTLRLSPDSFFQANKAAAEIMYDVALRMAKPRHFTTLLDLYCGTGVKLAQVLSQLQYSSDVVAIVNPGRAGASEGVVSLLRKNPSISRVVYISCKPDNPLTMKNFVQLCEKMGSESKPFVLKRAVPVDLFPYTNSYELILCFEKT